MTLLLLAAIFVVGNVAVRGSVAHFKGSVPNALPARVEPLSTLAPAPRNATPDFPAPHLTTLELLTLQTHVRGSNLYIEWGSGASTSLVAPLAAHAVSIDNNAEWCARVAQRDDVAWWVAHGVLELVCVDTGMEVGRRGGWRGGRRRAARRRTPSLPPLRPHRLLWRPRPWRRPHLLPPLLGRH